MANVYKYYNNGFLRISGIYGITCFTYTVDGYYYNTQVIRISTYFDSEKPDKNNITVEINDGGYHSSPHITKALKKMLSDILFDIDCDMGSEWENKAYFDLYKTIQGAFTLYFNKYRKCEYTKLTDKYNKNQKFYFNF